MRVLGVLAALTVLLAAGCSDDDPGPEPDRPEGSTTSADADPTGAGLCAVVTADDVQAWLAVERPVEGPEQLSEAWRCAVGAELGDPLEVEWTFHAPEVDRARILATEVDPGLAQETVSIEGTDVLEARGAVGPFQLVEEVVSLPDGHTLVVRVSGHRDDATEQSAAQAETAARGIAGAYLTRAGFDVPPLG